MVPLCVSEKMCQPVEIDNAVLASDNRPYRISERIFYDCMDGYEGRLQRTCLNSGWSGHGVCKGKE